MWIQRLKTLFTSDFAFRQDSTLAYLPLVIAFLTMLCISMAHGAAFIKQVTLSESESLRQRMHLHIPHHATDTQRSQLFAEIDTIAEIEVAEEISRSDVHAFLERWLGVDEAIADDFPLPTIIDITLLADANRDDVQERLQYYLSQHIDGALLESYEESITAFNESGKLVKTGIYLLGLIVLATTTLIVVIASRINLGVHMRHIEILHGLGASDHYINRQFIKRTAIISLQGVTLGTLVAILFIEIIKATMETGFLPGNSSLRGVWASYIGIPALLVALVLSSAWLSIETQLRKMH